MECSFQWGNEVTSARHSGVVLSVLRLGAVARLTRGTVSAVVVGWGGPPGVVCRDWHEGQELWDRLGEER